jgi:hypothetical protein
MKAAAVALIGLVAALAVLVLVANVVIPFAAPPPNRPTPTIPAGALLDCPRAVAGCR